jgi:pimeloyl-ACP methyl ester carboxylesterase
MRVPYSGEKQIEANGLTLTYDTFGSEEAPPLLLIMGLGGQLIAWPADLCQQLALSGYWVIRFDNRDIGRSTKFDAAAMPNFPRLLLRFILRLPLKVPYLLKDMAADTVGLLDALGIERAHVVGASMGGMIVQELLIHHRERLKTAVSIMSTTGDRKLPWPSREVMTLLRTPPAKERAAYIEQSVRSWHVLAGNHFPFHAERVREQAGQAYDRGLNPAGTARQMAAILASGSRQDALRSVTTPTLVIHGDADPLVPVAGGQATAKAIPNANLLIIPGMGHSLPIETWPQVVEAIAEHAVDAAAM